MDRVNILEPFSEFADSRSSIDDHEVFATSDFKRAGISSMSHIFWARDGIGASSAPKFEIGLLVGGDRDETFGTPLRKFDFKGIWL